MSDLIARVRSLIGDPASASQQFDDQTIQDVLDESRVNVWHALLRAEWTLTAGGIASYLDYYADQGDWESDAVLQDGHFNVITPATSDYLTGHWTFTLAAPGQLPPLFITGKWYDKYAAASELLERWAALWTENYDYSANGKSWRRSQAFQAKLDLAAQYRKKMQVHMIPMERTDETGDQSGVNVAVGSSDVWGW